MDAHGDGTESAVEVELRGLSIYTHHGVTDAEQEVGQRLVFDISFDVPALRRGPHRPGRGHDRLRRGLRHRRPGGDRAQLPHAGAALPGGRRAADRALRLRRGARARGQARAAAALSGRGGRGRGDAWSARPTASPTTRARASERRAAGRLPRPRLERRRPRGRAGRRGPGRCATTASRSRPSPRSTRPSRSARSSTSPTS